MNQIRCCQRSHVSLFTIGQNLGHECLAPGDLLGCEGRDSSRNCCLRRDQHPSAGIFDYYQIAFPEVVLAANLSWESHLPVPLNSHQTKA